MPGLRGVLSPGFGCQVTSSLNTSLLLALLLEQSPASLARLCLIVSEIFLSCVQKMLNALRSSCV